MFSKLSLVIVPILFAAAHASAAPVTVEYKATISTIGTPDGNVDSSDRAGFHIAVGEVLTGYFSYDTATFLPHDPLAPSWSMDYLLEGQVVSSLQFNNRSGALTFANDSETGASARDDFLAISTEASGDVGRISASFVRWGAYQPLNDHLPNPAQWSGFSSTGSRVTYFAPYTGNRDDSVWVDADINSFRVVSSVPEPSMGLMLGAGLGLLAWARSKRRLSATT